MKDIADALRREDRFVITTHVFPDGDAIGSAVAFRHLMTRLGKEAQILLPSRLPRKFDFLARDFPVFAYPDDWRHPQIERLENLVTLDFSTLERLDAMAQEVPGQFRTILCLDHHLCDAPFAHHKVIRPSASSTAELIWELATDHLAVAIDREIAEPLYVALVSETGSFHYGNTSPRVHRIVAELLETGISPEDCFGLLNERKSLDTLRLQAEALDRLRIEGEGRLGWIGLEPGVFQRLSVTEEETAGLVTMARSIEGVEVAILLYEDVPGAVKVSFRSKCDGIDMNALAKRFGGGGHVRAAGAFILGRLSEVAPRVIAAAVEVLAQARMAPPEGAVDTAVAANASQNLS